MIIAVLDLWLKSKVSIQQLRSAPVPSALFFLLLLCRDCEDFCDRNRGSSVFTDFHGLVHHQQHQTGDDPSSATLTCQLLEQTCDSWKHLSLPLCVWHFLLQIWTKIQNEESVILFLVVWTFTEITRYSYYTFSLLHHLPYFIKWARWRSLDELVLLLLCCNLLPEHDAGDFTSGLLPTLALHQEVVQFMYHVSPGSHREQHVCVYWLAPH